MSDVQNYGISLSFKKAITALNKFKKSSERFNKSQENALKTQIKLAEKLKKTLNQPVKPMTVPPTGKVPRGSPSTGNAGKSLLATKLKNEQKLSDKVELDGQSIVQKALTKRLEKEEKERTRIVLAEAKERKRKLEAEGKVASARRVQAVAGLTQPSGASSMKSFYQQQEKDAAKLEKTNARIANQAERQAKALQEAKTQIMTTSYMLKRNLSTSEKETREAIKTSIANAKTAKEVRNAFRFHKNNTAQLQKQQFLMRRMQQSSEQFAGNMVSAFALASGGAAITRVGQDFEAVANTMLAVSVDSKEAATNLGFVKDEAFRLGLGLTEASKGFAKMVAARGEMSLSDTKEAFTGISEMSTLLGLSAEESNRAINALQQMMSKGVVSAEELKLQMGEVLPNAIQIMAKSAGDAGLTLNGTVAEMMDLQQTGGLISKEVLPVFAKNMRDAAAANGGLEKAINSNRVAMNRMVTSFQMAADDFFKSGFGEGLTDMFNSIGKLMKDNSTLWESLGKIVGGVLKALSVIIDEVLNPILSALGSILNLITTALGDFSGILVAVVAKLGFVGKALEWVWGLLSGGQGIVGALTRTFTRLLTPILLVVGALEELAEFFAPTGKKTLIGTNIDEIMPDFNKINDAMVSAQTKMSNDSPQAEEALKEIYAPRANSSFAGASSYGQAFAGKQVIEVPVYLDGNQIGQAVAETTPMNDAIDRRIADSSTSAYD